MTALASYWSFDTRGQHPDAAVERMLRGQQIYAPQAPVVAPLGDVALGRRLFPTLPEDAFDRGPVVGGGGRWTLVADVRLDAREDLCTELAIDRSDGGSLSDSALVMRAIERWGEDAIPRLIGDFALILWDARDRRLILARDFLGKRPLHYHQGGGFFAVASMPKGLHALPEIPREPDPDAVSAFLVLLPEKGPKSFFRQIERVLPGEMVTVSPDGLRRRQYWDFQPNRLGLTDDDYVEATRELFDRAVRARLRGAGGQAGSHLSGGLDSSAVAASAARLLAPEGKVVGFTAVPREGFDGRPFAGRFNDEGAHAAAVAALYPNLEHELVRSGGQSPFADLDRNFSLYDRPVLNLCNGVWMHAILDRCKQRGLPVLLTGEMGNMSFSHEGLDRLSALFASGRLIKLAREMLLLRRNGTRLRRSAAQAVGPFLPPSLWLLVNRWFGRAFDIRDYSAIRAEKAAELEDEARQLGLDYSYRPWRDALAMRKWVIGRIDGGSFRKGFLAGWGVDVRDPTSDRRLIELCLSMPPEQFERDGQTRSLARRAFADRLPPMVLNESRKGYQAADWHEGLRSGWSEAAFQTERIADHPAAAAIMDTERLGRLVESDQQSVNWDSLGAQTAYRLALLRGLSAGHFIRRASGAN